jgi:septal ring factor EnvC (AmiA/AmiB activator)
MDKLQPEQTHSDLKMLVNVIETLPGEVQVTLRGALNQLNNSLNRKQRILKIVQDTLGQIRLDMKYLIFDLEATRRERDELKRKLEND